MLHSRVSVTVRLSVDTQFLNYVKRYPYHCVADDDGGLGEAWDGSHEMSILGHLQTMNKLIDPAHLAHSSV